MSRSFTPLVLAVAAFLALPALAGADVRGDFNADGVEDAAIAAPYDSFGSVQYAGSVHVIYGKKKKGLRANRSELFTEDTPGIDGTAADNGYFGLAMTVGDFNGRGGDDLAIASPDRTVGGDPYAGGVYVLYGKKKKGLSTNGSQLWTKDTPGIPGAAEPYDYLGYYAIAADDFDGNGADDLAIENEYATVGGNPAAGAVLTIYGKKRKGLRAKKSQLLSEDTEGVPDESEQSENFAYEGLMTGDFDRDGRADLAIDSCYEVIGGDASAGAVFVLYGKKKKGLVGNGSQMFSQDTPGIDDEAEVAEYFGYPSMAAGNFDGRGGVDLAIGSSYELDKGDQIGAVNVLYARKKKGLRAAGSDFLTEGSPGVGGSTAPNESFGDALAAGNFDRKKADDLAIANPYEEVGGDSDAGAVFVVYGKRKKGLGHRPGQLFTQDTRGIEGAADLSEYFGYVLAPGNFNARGGDDLLIASPFETVEGLGSAGVVDVLYGKKKKGLRTAGAQRFSQGTPGIAGDPGSGDEFGGALTAPAENP
jgi:hypothetical protein